MEIDLVNLKQAVMDLKKLIPLTLMLVGSLHINAQNKDDFAIHVSLVRSNFATMTNARHPENRIGYRFHEHEPITYGKIPESNAEAGIEPDSIDQQIASFKKQREVFIYKHEIGQSDHWARQTWTYYIRPAHDGIEMILLIETFDRGLPEYYGVQQCFRMSGTTNSEWRKEIALTPAFSEYDHWKEATSVEERQSLTYVSRSNHWEALPPTDSTVGARTPLGGEIDKKRTGGTPMKKVGPYRAEMLDPIDHGLITRVDSDGIWVCGIHWERTSHVTDHHPADCLHSIVNIGNIPPHSRRIIKGKIYWFEGGLEELSEKFISDFR